jgi:hypothetical protein
VQVSHSGFTADRARLIISRGIIRGYVGHVEEGRRLLAEALLAMEASNQGNRLVEAYRLQGELLLRQATPDVAQAEACFQ